MLVSEHLGGPRQSQEARYDYDDEDEGYEGCDTRRAWSSTPSPRQPQRLWDRYSD